MNGKFRVSTGIATHFLSAASFVLAAVNGSYAYNVIWNTGTGNFVGSQTWSYGADGTLQSTDNPFLLPDAPSNFGGENVAFLGNNGNVTLNSTTTGGGAPNGLFGIRLGSMGPATNLTAIGGGNYGGNATLTVTGPTPLTLYDVAEDSTAGHFFVGHLDGEGTLNWNSTDTLTIQGRLRVGEDSIGTVNHNSGTIIASNVGGPAKFISVGALGGTGIYNLNDGKLELGAAINPVTGLENPRLLRIGLDPNSTGIFNLGDGIGAAESAHLEMWDDVFIGEFGNGANGQMNIRSDGLLQVHGVPLFDANDPLVNHFSPIVIGSVAGATGVLYQEGGRIIGDGMLEVGRGGNGTYQLVGSTGQVDVRALRVGSNGVLDFTFDAAGATTITLEGSLNTNDADPAKGITLLTGATLGINLTSYALDNDVTLVNSLDSTAGILGSFANYAQGAAVGTNALGTQFYINYFGGADNNDIILQTTQPTNSATDGLVWNATTANFDAGWAKSDGSFGAIPNQNPFGTVEDLYLGKGGVAVLDASTRSDSGNQVLSLRVGTGLANARINGTNGNGTLTAEDARDLTIGNGLDNQGGVIGDLYVGGGGFTGTVNWNSTGTLNAEGKFKIGFGGTGVVNQNAGVVTGGTKAGGGKYLPIGEGAGGVGTYNLNEGTLQPGLIGDFALRRLLRVGLSGAQGTLVVGDGSGAAGSARIESLDDLIIGELGGTGTLTVNSDAEIVLTGNDAPFYVGLNNGNGTATQNGGSITAGGLVSIGDLNGAIGHYTMTSGTLDMDADNAPDELRVGGNGGTGTFRVEGDSVVSNATGDLFIAWLANPLTTTGRLELVGSDASFTVGRLENAPDENNFETIRFEADVNGVTPLTVTGTTMFAGATGFVQLQDPIEFNANTGINGNGDLMGHGIALELDLSAITTNMSLTLIDNQSTEPITGFFENPSVPLKLFEEGQAIAGTGFNGSVTISYLGGTGGNDVVLTLVASAGLTGDYNGDGTVDAADYVVWRKTNIGGSQGYSDWRANFGKSTGGGSAGNASTGAVPEPTTAALVIVGLLGTMFATRRNS